MSRVGPPRVLHKLTHKVSKSFALRVALSAVIVASSIILLLAILSYTVSRSMMTQSIEEELQFIATRAGDQLSLQLENVVLEVQELSNNLLFSNALTDSVERAIYLRPYLDNLKSINGHPVNICLTDFLARPIACNTSEPFFTTSERLAQMVIDDNASMARIRSHQHSSSVMIAFPVIYPPTGLAEGMLIAEVKLDGLLQKLFEAIPEKFDVYITQNGIPIAECDHCADEPISEQLSFVRSIPAKLALTKNLNLAILIGENYQEAFTGLQRLTHVYILTGFSILLITWFISLTAARHLVRPLTQLAQRADEIANEGHMDPNVSITTRRSDEIGQLANSFRKMLLHLNRYWTTLEHRVEERTDQLQKREKELQQQQRDYRTIFDVVEASIWYVDGDGKILRANRQASLYSGLPENQLVGKSIQSILPTSLVDDYLQNAPIIFQSGEPILGKTLRVENASGEDHWYHIDKTPFIDEDGDVTGIILFINDVSVRVWSEKKLKESESRYRDLVELSPDAILTVVNGKVVFANSRTAEIFAIDPGHSSGLLNLPITTLFKESQATEFPEIVASPEIIGNETRLFNLELLSFKGEILIVEASITSTRFGDQLALQMVLRDITERVRNEESVRLAATVFNTTTEAIVIVDHNRRVESVNQAFIEIMGGTDQEFIGLPCSLLNSPRLAREMRNRIWDNLEKKGNWQGEAWARSHDNEDFPIWLNASRSPGVGENDYRYVFVFSDITKLKDSEQRLATLAYYDSLTNLPNRALFHERLMHAMARHERSQDPLALLFIDLDRFKLINDSLGHDIGDLLLQSVATRIGSCVRDVDTVARLGGDEFTVILEKPGTRNSIVEICERILAALTRPFHLKGNEIYSGCSIGISRYPEDSRSSEELLKHADTAMYRAKKAGRHGYAFYEQEMSMEPTLYISLEAALREALDKNQLHVVYQPRVSAIDNHVTAVEALVRWQHPEKGLMMPSEFLPIAETSGLIRRIDWWVLEQVCRQYRHWQEEGVAIPRVSVNFSMQNIRDASVIARIDNLIADYNLSNHWLELELDAPVFMDVSAQITNNIRSLRHLGITIIIDNFGETQISLRQLRDLPVDGIKISGSFSRNLGQPHADHHIVQAIIDMAQGLNLRTSAEEVETRAQADALKEMGVQEFQGFYFAKPTEAKQLHWLSNGSTLPRSNAVVAINVNKDKS